jgi:predicted phage tail protein
VDIKAVIDEVARRHNIRLAPDDPILATITVTEIIHQVFADHLKTLVADVANQATDRLSAQIEAGRREIAAETDHAKIAASKLVNDAGAWSSEKLKETSATAANEILDAVTAGVAAIRAGLADAKRARRGAIWAAALTVGIGAGFLGSGIGFWLAGK